VLLNKGLLMKKLVTCEKRWLLSHVLIKQKIGFFMHLQHCTGSCGLSNIAKK
jgi:hypothetical protein